MPTALVTGASSGIGAAFARRLAADGYDVIAVARRRSRLEQLQERGGASELIVADLADSADCLRVEKRLAAGEIELLVNNAGIGVGKAFEHTSVDEEDRMLALNVRALMRLTHAAIPPMLAAGSGEIVNVGSVAAFTGAVGFGSYSASKAYVVALSESLAVRYASRGVTVMALCPGYVRTEMHDAASTPASGLVARLMWLDPEQLVDFALRDLRRGKVISTPGAVYKTAVATTKLVPRRVLSVAGRFANRGGQ
jgi:short-subunit dehydrogenase